MSDLAHPIFPRTVLRVRRGNAIFSKGDRFFRIYGVEQAMHVFDPRRIVPRNDNVCS